MLEEMLSRSRPACATGFYPSDRVRCLRQLEELLDEVQLPESLPSQPLGGLVPHAGWVYSGATAAHLWAALASSDEPPELVVLLGAVHVPGVRRATAWEGSSWESPLGPVPVACDFIDALVELCGPSLGRGSEAHDGEHSLEVQVPFVRHLLPEASIVPIAVPADERALELGAGLARAVAADPRRIAVVASSDLTHYGPRYGFAPVGTGPEALAWSRANDRRLVERAEALDASGVLLEASAHRNACGSGALASGIEAARTLGATRGLLLEQTTSWDARPGGPADLFVGYASLLFA